MALWRIHPSASGPDTCRWTVLDARGGPLAFGAVVRAWHADDGFRAFWRERLREVPFDAYAWECPPVTAQTISREFECVFVASPMLARMAPDAGAFAEHFRPDRSVVTFANLGADAVLVAPCPGTPDSDYAQLARFTATAPPAQQDAFWQAVGAAMKKRIDDRPVWLSTAGLGVAWLHVRLDDRPKYYRHAPYARP
jgi:hypothetical protein